MPRHSNQTLIDIMQIKSEPIASYSPWLILKLIEDQGCKYNDKKSRLFVRKLSCLWSKNELFIFCNLGVINVWMCCVESIPPAPLIKKFCLVRIGFNYKKLLYGWVLRPQAPLAYGSWGLRPQTPTVVHLSYVSLLNTTPTLGIFAF